MTPPTESRAVELGPAGTSAADVVAVTRRGARVELTSEAIAAMEASRAVVDRLAEAPEPTYSISTGLGALAVRHIPPEEREQLQRSLVRSHAAGMGDPVEREVVRALLFLRTKALWSGRTGARPVLAETLAAMLNAGGHARRPRARLARLQRGPRPARPLRARAHGEGEAFDASGARPGRSRPHRARRAGASRGETGLALINGTEGKLVLAIEDVAGLCRVADVSAAMSTETLLGTDQAFGAELQEPLRPHPGQALSAGNLFRSWRPPRSSPRTAAATRASTSNGNFLGAPLGYVLDFLAIAAADLASIS